MGFTLYYRSTRPVPRQEAEAIAREALAASHGRTWLSCEPPAFFGVQDDGHLLGGSKPNFLPDTGDRAAADRSGLPYGTTKDLIDILCQLSRDHAVDWEFSHEAHPGPAGYIRAGVCDDEVFAQVEMFADLEDIIAEFTEDLPDDKFD